MAVRVSPTERIRAGIDEPFDTEGDLGETLEEVARLGARLLLQSALEAEVTEFLGRNRYERRRLAKTAKAGSRNGYGQITVKTMPRRPSVPEHLSRLLARGGRDVLPRGGRLL